MALNGFLAIPVKSTSEVDLIVPLKKFISTAFGKTAPDDLEKSLTDFHRLRNQSIAKFQDKHETALETVYRYYDQLRAVEAKLPLTEDQIRINFKWTDPFTKGGLLSSRSATLAVPLGSYERCCVLYNIAAIQSQVAAVQSRDLDEGMKTSAKLFQLSSGILKHLKEHVMGWVQRDPTRDLHPDTLAALSALQLAQAQESIYTKALADRMKDGIIAKICMQCAELYADALKLMQLHSIKDLWPKDWLPTVAGKQALYHGLAEYYQSGVAKATKSFGEEISRLNHAKELLQAAMTRGGKEIDFSREMSRIEQSLKAAEKDNSFIYHDKVPDVRSLPSVGKAVVAKALPVSEVMSANFKDLFASLLPIEVIGALSMFENRKSEMVNMEVGRLRESTQLLNSVLASLNLPAALEDTDGSAVPESLLGKSATVQQSGGVARIAQLITDLPTLLQRNKEILDEASTMLSEEAASDVQLREQFGAEKWTRMPSEKLTEGPRLEEVKYRTIIDNAVAADEVVKSRFENARRGMELLSGGRDAVSAALPAGSPVAALKGSGAVQELRRLMREVEDIKSLRGTLEEQFTGATFDDMNSRFMAALAQDGALTNEEAVSRDALNSRYEPLREQVTASIQAQEESIAKIQTSNNEFSNQKASNQSAANRDAMLKELAESYDAFMGLKENLEEGTKFYNDLTPILLKYQNKISDLCFARKTEKEELLKDMQTSIAAQPSGQAPNAPAYQQSSGGGPPKRPPPPAPAAVKPAESAAAPPKPTPRARPNVPAPAATFPGAQPPAGSAPPPAAAPSTSTLPYPIQPQMPYPMMTMPGGYNPYGGYTAAYTTYPGQQPYPGQPQQQPYPVQQQPYPVQGQQPLPQGGYAQPSYPPPGAAPMQYPYPPRQ